MVGKLVAVIQEKLEALECNISLLSLVLIVCLSVWQGSNEENGQIRGPIVIADGEKRARPT